MQDSDAIHGTRDPYSTGDQCQTLRLARMLRLARFRAARQPQAERPAPQDIRPGCPCASCEWESGHVRNGVAH